MSEITRELARFAARTGWDSLPEEVIKENIEKTTIDQIIQALTKSPVASASDSTQTTAAGRIVMKGSHQEIAESLIRDGLFTDGLAVTPPTSYLVEELLDYTDCSADEEIAETAIQEDVDVIGLNIGGRYNTVRDLIDILKEKKIMDRLLIVGGTIPP